MMGQSISQHLRQWANARLGGNAANGYGFHGGLVLETNKRALADVPCTNIKEIPLPKQLTIALTDYHANTLTPLVHPQEHVVRGQLIASGIAAPASGVVSAIEPKALIHPGELSAISVVIECSAEQPVYEKHQPLEKVDVLRKIKRFIESPDALLQSALVGLGGAGFPTIAKLQSATEGVETLIINAAECEPEIACDEALMQCEANAIANGIEGLIHLSNCNECIIAIEDSKQDAIAKMRVAIEGMHSKPELVVIPTRYPTGAQSPLIETLTGKRIPHGSAPSEQGVLCLNVGTAYALWQAIDQGHALDSRVVSLGGSAMPNPCNVRVRFGTPVSFVLEATNNSPDINNTRIRAGGPLSGFDLTNLSLPISAKTNCILAEPITSDAPAQDCIRCGQCADVCPSRLLPQQLYWHTQNDAHDKCAKLNLQACFECGCCDLVCPSSIKLTETFRYAKSVAKQLELENTNAKDAELRFVAREKRLERREEAKQAAIAARKSALKKPEKPDADRIKAALERARSKRSTGKE